LTGLSLIIHWVTVHWATCASLLEQGLARLWANR
jgi:hypothetical protein